MPKAQLIAFGFLLCGFSIHCNGPKIPGRLNKFETLLRDVRPCANPQPAYAKLRKMYSISEIYVNKTSRLMKGNVTLKDSVPFRNFSARSFAINSAGQRELKFQIFRVNCRHFIAKTILQFVTIKYDKRNCLLSKGIYHYVIDINKIAHSLPAWRDEGRNIHELQIVANGVTVACNEVVVDNQMIT